MGRNNVVSAFLFDMLDGFSAGLTTLAANFLAAFGAWLGIGCALRLAVRVFLGV